MKKTLLFFCIFGFFIISYFGRYQPVSLDLVSPTTKTCEIKGEVKNPGVYTIKWEGTIQDLIGQAGGLLDTADTSTISLVKEINDKEVVVTSVGTNGSSYENVGVVSFKGEPFEVSCSGKYLIDAIKAISADEVTLSFSGELKPFVISDKNDDSIIQLISPVRTYK